MHQNSFEAEVERNYEAFADILPSLLNTRRGEFALLRHGAVEAFFRNEAEALAAGRSAFKDGLFSVQEVTDRPADLGFFSHAIDPRLA